MKGNSLGNKASPYDLSFAFDSGAPSLSAESAFLVIMLACVV